MCMESGLSGCSGRGECSELTGQPLCHCDEGYSGVKCEKCDVDVSIHFTFLQNVVCMIKMILELL